MLRDIYFVPDFLGSSGISLFSGASEVGDPVDITGFSAVVLVNRLDDNHQYFSVFVESPMKQTKAMQIVFLDGKKPNFERFGFSLKGVDGGFIVYMKQESFSLIHGGESWLALGNESWFDLKNIFNNAAKLYHLGIINDLNYTLKSIIENREIRAKWENCNNFNEFFEAVDVGILLSASFFCFNDVTKIISNFKNETYKYGCLLEPIANCFISSNIQKFLTAEQRKYSNIFKLIEIFKSVVECLTVIYPQIYDIDLTSSNEIEIHFTLVEYIHSFQKEKNLPVGKCNEQTISKIFEEVRMTQNHQSPFFKMAKINISLINEIDFQNLPSFESTSEDPSEIIDSFLKTVFLKKSNPDFKIECMNNMIKKENNRLNEQSKELIQRVSDIDKKISILTEQIEQSSNDSNLAISTVCSASKKINEVYNYMQALQEKYFTLNEILNVEQKRTRTVLFIVIIFSIIYRFLLNK